MLFTEIKVSILLTIPPDSHDSDSDEFQSLGILSPDEGESPSATTYTQSSSRASPRHPSDLQKNHFCDFAGCDKSFNRPAKLAQHMRSHTNTRPFICPHLPCTKDFLRDSHLKHHIKSAHTNIRDYCCTWQGCTKSFITATRLRRHEAAHEGKEKFRCSIEGCGQSFRKHGTLQKHIIMIHEGRDPFVCEAIANNGIMCGAGFDTESKLTSHVSRAHKTKTYLCAICTTQDEQKDQDTSSQNLEAVFPTHAELQAHINSVHPPTCTECGLKCTSRSALKNHLEVIHGGFDIDERRTHLCSEPDCGRGFTKRGNLNAHIQVDHAGKRFICGKVDPKILNDVAGWDGSDACGEACKSKRTLERHVRSVHVGLESDNKIKTKKTRGSAKRSTSNTDALTLTRLTGAGYEAESGRNIPCSVEDCDHRFMRWYDFEIHLQTWHGMADSEIQDLQTDGIAFPQLDLGNVSERGNFQGFQESMIMNPQWGNEYGAHCIDHLAEAGAFPYFHTDSKQAAYSDTQPLRNGSKMEQLMNLYNQGYNDEHVEMIDPSLR